MAMIPRERSDYSAIIDRPPLKLPGKARIVFWSIVNYEVWDIGKPMARQLLPAPTGVPLMPDVVHWGFHEYGMRVGCWRFFDLYERLGVHPTLATNARVCEDYTRVAEEAKLPVHIFHFKIRGKDAERRTSGGSKFIDRTIRFFDERRKIVLNFLLATAGKQRHRADDRVEVEFGEEFLAPHLRART